jgi:hypothetical protein
MVMLPDSVAWFPALPVTLMVNLMCRPWRRAARKRR